MNKENLCIVILRVAYMYDGGGPKKNFCGGMLARFYQYEIGFRSSLTSLCL